MWKYLATIKTVWHEEHIVEANSAEEAESIMTGDEISNEFQYTDSVYSVEEYDDE